jgi:hypothetical protein
MFSAFFLERNQKMRNNETRATPNNVSPSPPPEENLRKNIESKRSKNRFIFFRLNDSDFGMECKRCGFRIALFLFSETCSCGNALVNCVHPAQSSCFQQQNLKAVIDVQHCSSSRNISKRKNILALNRKKKTKQNMGEK